ncbi:UDP:flavonoid glycosyltransferase YjiC, YdhE family [Sphingomonas sp. NFR04]|uniref:glycosyltransferase n=1 Tax=Sphingomonas sp. NFR04 TaxID=1566283 RepID=UPI0008E614EC|nr:glycosyltransferase [Sphingomonas sp. NFR04]SFK05634.1 UDP:flavonoid glycosyltransferase YjiC, YdhE family [Sphingomonas sp. NFR04]
MRIAIFTIGTQGDVRPFAAFGRHLQAQGHDVTIATSDRHRALTDQVGLRLAPLESDYAALMARERALIDGGNQLKIAGSIASTMMAWVPQWARQGMEAARGADLVLGSGSGTILGAAVAERLGVPFVQAQFMPLTPSRHMAPIWPLPGMRLPGAANLALSHALRIAMWRLLARPSNALRETLGLRAFPLLGPWYERGQRVRPQPILYAFSKHLQPQPADWLPGRAAVVGFWSLDQGRDWTPPPALRDFLDAGPPPLYVGFGSMLSGDQQRFTQLILDAVRRTGRRAIIATGWGALESVQAPPNVLFVKDAPHDWLFPRVALAVHHGGAGTTAAATRAGLPQVVVPFLADQFFWAWRLERAGVNPVLLDRRTMTAQDLADAISLASRERVRAAATRFGGLLQAEHGMENATQALERWGLLPAAQAGRVRQLA